MSKEIFSFKHAGYKCYGYISFLHIWTKIHSIHVECFTIGYLVLYKSCFSKEYRYFFFNFECKIVNIFLFLISQPKHMLLVLKRTVWMRRFFWAPKHVLKLIYKKIFTILLSNFLLNWTYANAHHFSLLLSGNMAAEMRHDSWKSDMQ